MDFGGPRHISNWQAKQNKWNLDTSSKLTCNQWEHLENSDAFAKGLVKY